MLRSPTVVHLHPTRIAENRVPRADSAAVVSYRDRPVGESRITFTLNAQGKVEEAKVQGRFPTRH